MKLSHILPAATLALATLTSSGCKNPDDIDSTESSSHAASHVNTFSGHCMETLDSHEKNLENTAFWEAFFERIYPSNQERSFVKMILELEQMEQDPDFGGIAQNIAKKYTNEKILLGTETRSDVIKRMHANLAEDIVAMLQYSGNDPVTISRIHAWKRTWESECRKHIV